MVQDNKKTVVCKSRKSTMGEEVYGSLISCSLNLQEDDLRPADPWLNSYGEKGHCEKSTTDKKSFSFVNVLFLQFPFGEIWTVHIQCSLPIVFQNCAETQETSNCCLNTDQTITTD